MLKRTGRITTALAIGFMATVAALTFALLVKSSSLDISQLHGEEALSYIKQEGIYSSLAEAMAAARYGVYETRHTSYEAQGEQFYINNPAQQYRAFFSPDRMRLVSEQKSRKHEWEMKLTGIGYGDDLAEVSTGKLSQRGNRIEYHREASLGQEGTAVIEWYENGKEGLEQGFEITKRVGQEIDAEWLRVKMEVRGNLRATLGSDGKSARLLDEQGNEVLSYRKLLAYDQEGRELATRMRVEKREVYLEVDDSEAVYPISVDPFFEQLTKVTASDAAALDQFGWSVSISGDTIVVGSQIDNTEFGNRAGSAYVFERDQGGAGNWGQARKLTASDAAAFDQFGGSVSISGDTIVVSAHLDNTESGTRAGSAHVFERDQGGAGNWGHTRKLTASDAAPEDLFGWSVSVNGNTIVVGAREADNGASTETGSAYVFERDQGGAGNWGQARKLTASDAAPGDRFGGSVSISGDTIVVGVNSDDSIFGGDSGSAYVFRRDQGGAGNWGQARKLTASDAAPGDNFGISVSISGDTIVVGAWLDDTAAGVNTGSAYVFRRDQGGAGNWGHTRKLTASDAAPEDLFGRSVSVSGNTIVVSAQGDDINNITDMGSAYIFSNLPPSIASLPVTIQQRPQIIQAVIATVSDDEGDGNLSVEVIEGGTATGITISSITIASGMVSADLSAACNASSGTVRLRVTDSGGLISTADLNVSVLLNDAPIITSVTGPAGPVKLGSEASVTVNYTDTRVEGHSAKFSWGDGSPNTTVTASLADSGSITASHTYAAAGVYSVTVTLSDECEASDTFVYESIRVVGKRKPPKP